MLPHTFHLISSYDRYLADKAYGNLVRWEDPLCHEETRHNKSTGNSQGTMRPNFKLLSDDKADSLAISLTHLIFRNGPVEDMHARGQLSENDMMVLNKYMVNKIATVLFLAKNGHWFELECLLKFHMLCGSQWDKPIVDLFDVYKLIELMAK